MDEESESDILPVLAIGELLIDFIVADDADSLQSAQTFVARAGGAPANVAVALARLGLPSAFCGVVGDDPFGRRLRDELEKEGVDTSRLRLTDQATTTFAYAWKDRRGDGHFWLNRGADVHLDQRDVAMAGVDRLAALVFGSVSLAAIPTRHAVEAAVDLAITNRVPVVFDVNLRPSVWANPRESPSLCMEMAAKSTVTKLSLDDAEGIFQPGVTPEAAIAMVLGTGPESVILTDGARGSWFAARAQPEILYVPAFTVTAVEPTGAGDAFLAALIARLIGSSWSHPTAEDVRYASAAGAFATTKHGAWDGLPDRARLESFLATV